MTTTYHLTLYILNHPEKIFLVYLRRAGAKTPSRKTCAAPEKPQRVALVAVFRRPI